MTSNLIYFAEEESTAAICLFSYSMDAACVVCTIWRAKSKAKHILITTLTILQDINSSTKYSAL